MRRNPRVVSPTRSQPGAYVGREYGPRFPGTWEFNSVRSRDNPIRRSFEPDIWWANDVAPSFCRRDAGIRDQINYYLKPIQGVPANGINSGFSNTQRGWFNQFIYSMMCQHIASYLRLFCWLSMWSVRQRKRLHLFQEFVNVLFVNLTRNMLNSYR